MKLQYNYRISRTEGSSLVTVWDMLKQRSATYDASVKPAILTDGTNSLGARAAMRRFLARLATA